MKKKKSVKQKLKEYLFKHVGKEVSREKLSKIANGATDWPRTIRTIRQETGLSIRPTKDGYILDSLEPVNDPRIRGWISDKLRYAVLQRDNSTCQRCGANTINTPNVKLVVDHKIPVDRGGKTDMDNLWTLCEKCNGGKKSFFEDKKTEQYNNILHLKTVSERLKALFEEQPNTVIDSVILSTFAMSKDWERSIRSIRKKFNMDIEKVSSEEFPKGGYIYHVD